MVVECDGCQKHFCNICIEMTADEYQVLQRPDCIWRCPDCATKVATNSTAKEWMKEILKDIDTKFTMLEILLQHRNTEIDQNLDKKLGEFEKKIEEKMNNLTNNITEEVPNRINMTWTELPRAEPEDYEKIRNILQSEKEKEKNEKEDQEQRERNIIIYRVEESSDTDPENRKNHDANFFEALCNNALKTGTVKTKQIIRLGKKNETNKRPMRITLEDKNDREKIMKNAKNLAEAEPMFKNISICNDYNKEEREKIRNSVEAARELSKNDPHFTYKVVGPPWKLRTRKVPK